MRPFSGNQEQPILPHWLLLAQRCVTALAVPMLITTGGSHSALIHLDFTALWRWDVLKATGRWDLFA